MARMFFSIFQITPNFDFIVTLSDFMSVFQ